MDVQTRRSIKVDLSSEPEFRLGPVNVVPPLRQVRIGRHCETLEPRVMQMLVVLAQARGEVVSRDELVLRCWDGVIVGENAINRVVSLLRAVAAGPCRGAFEIETIKKVGYRLVIRSAPAQVPEWKEQSPSRRSLLMGAAILGTGAVAGGAWVWQRARQPSPLAEELVARGRLAQKQGLFTETEQAIAFFTEAVRIEPDYADAWGALALSYRHKMIDDPTSNAQGYARLIDGAARRALTLDADNADALVARLIKTPSFGRWAEREGAYRALLKQFPDHWLLRGTLARLYYDVGRWSAGLPLFEQNVAQDPFLPVSRIYLAQGLWHLGRPQEAEQVCREALERWPKHNQVWLFSFSFRALSGRPEMALGMADRESERPVDLPLRLIERNIAWARAMATGKAEDVLASTRTLTELADTYPDTIPFSAPVLAAFGDADGALAMAQRYFDPVKGTRADLNPAYRLGWRDTAFLFSAPFAGLRGDPRFSNVTTRIGLNDYWRATGTRPDPLLSA